jgi:hypothetical protein
MRRQAFFLPRRACLRRSLVWRRSTAFFAIPLGLILGRPLSPFSRAISSRKAAFSARKRATSSNNWTTNRLTSSRLRASISGGDSAIAP